MGGDETRCRGQQAAASDGTHTAAKRKGHLLKWVLVHEMYELGIVADFSGQAGQEPEDDAPRVIRFPGA